MNTYAVRKRKGTVRSAISSGPTLRDATTSRKTPFAFARQRKNRTDRSELPTPRSVAPRESAAARCREDAPLALTRARDRPRARRRRRSEGRVTCRALLAIRPRRPDACARRRRDGRGGKRVAVPDWQFSNDRDCWHATRPTRVRARARTRDASVEVRRSRIARSARHVTRPSERRREPRARDRARRAAEAARHDSVSPLRGRHRPAHPGGRVRRRPDTWARRRTFGLSSGRACPRARACECRGALRSTLSRRVRACAS